jgi:hypothetical protein
VATGTTTTPRRGSSGPSLTRRLVSNPRASLGGLVLVIIVVAAIFAEALSPY